MNKQNTINTKRADMKFSNADGLVYTSSMAIYAQAIHQLGQIIFNHRENEADYKALIEQLNDARKKLEDNTLKLKELIESK